MADFQFTGQAPAPTRKPRTRKQYANDFTFDKTAEGDKNWDATKVAQLQPKIQQPKQKSPDQPKKQGILQKLTHNKVTDVTGSLAKGAVSSEKTLATGIARVLPGGTADINAQAKASDVANKDLKFIKQQQKAGKIKPEDAKRLIEKQSENAGEASQELHKTVNEMPSKKQIAAGAAGTAFDIATAGVGTGGLKELKVAAEKGLKQGAKELGKQSAKTAAISAPAGGLSVAASEKNASVKDIGKGAVIAGATGAALPLATAGVGKVAGKVKEAIAEKLGKNIPEPIIKESTPTISEAEHQSETANLSQHHDQELENIKNQPTLTQKPARDKLEEQYQHAQNALDVAGAKPPTYPDRVAETDAIDPQIQKNADESRKIDQQLELLVAKKKDTGKVTEVDKVKTRQLNDRKQELQPESAATGITQPTEAITETKPSNSGELKPIGEGETRTSKLSTSIQQKAVDKKLTESLGDLPEYKQVNMKEQAQKATDLLATDESKAIRIATGKEAPPGDILPESVGIAVENKALEDGNVDLLRQLAHSTRAGEATAMGQRIRALAERDPDSAVAKIREVAEVRANSAKRSLKSPSKAITKTSREIKANVLPVKRQDWHDFVEGLKC